ncbi:hypothetical protein JHK82_039323 [Glycine max]|nr:hypothetical protein JHK85_040079 [Glycine max]KAG5110100.1 hypothetical protein JHK82_039323 [Glycine max]KAG5121385.1 hypothetical protein JHK84_039725 [Glycine max]
MYKFRPHLSNSGNRQFFSDATIELANELVKRNIDLVYGGGSVGLMGLISQRMYDGGCHVLGLVVIGLIILSTRISGEPVGEVRIVSDMHEPKAAMAQGADAFIALPGFIKRGARNILVTASPAKELMMKMEQYSPSHEHVASHDSWQTRQLVRSITGVFVLVMVDELLWVKAKAPRPVEKAITS